MGWIGSAQAEAWLVVACAAVFVAVVLLVERRLFRRSEEQRRLADSEAVVARAREVLALAPDEVDRRFDELMRQF